MGTYLRTTQRRNRDGSTVRYVQVAHNRRVDGVTQAEVLLNLGREDQVTALRRCDQPGEDRPLLPDETVSHVMLRNRAYADCVRQEFAVTVDEQALDVLRRAAAHDGVGQDELVGEALRRWFGLRGVGVLDDLAERRAAEADRFDDEAAIALLVREVRAARADRRARGA